MAPKVMTKTVEYKGKYFGTYAKERADMIAAGWKVIDCNLIEKIVCGPIGSTGPYVTGFVVYEKP